MKMTPKLSDKTELISPEDLAIASDIWTLLERAGWWTYEFNIASDTLTDREETQS